MDLYIFNRDGLDFDILSSLSYKTSLDTSLNKTLRRVDKELLLADISLALRWYDMFDYKSYNKLGIDYRIKSQSSSVKKYFRYLDMGKPIEKVFNDLLGFRSICNSYDELENLKNVKVLKYVDMRQGKANDDGYRGVHIYFQLDHKHYPIEIQYNTYYDRALNNWLHFYLYKEKIPKKIGVIMRREYENGNIRSETEFKEVLKNVLSNSEG